MRDLNIEFQEQYKRLDKLCREMYSFGEGVSAYIQDMENTPYTEQCTVYNWESIYKELKHARWMRNQLAHDISIDTDFSEQSDIEFVKRFYESIMNGSDPLACAYKAKQAAMQKRNSPSKISNENQPTITVPEAKPRKSLWNRIISKIKSWFS